jgi:autotransporter adhesin
MSFRIGNNSFAIVNTAVASGAQAVALGQTCLASGENTLATGNGAVAHFSAMRAHGGANIAQGAAQEIAFALSGKTTTDSEVILFMRANSLRAVLRAGSVWTGIVHIAGSKSDGSAVARYHRQVTIKRVVNTTSLVGSVITLGTDEAAGTSIDITADDTNEALSVGVTGVSGETWRWVAVFHGAELVIGT